MTLKFEDFNLYFGDQVTPELVARLTDTVKADFASHPPATKQEGYERIQAFWDAIKPKPDPIQLNFNVNFTERVLPEVQAEILAHLRADFDQRPPQTEAEGYQRIRAYCTEHYILKINRLDIGAG